MKALEYFPQSEANGTLASIVRNKLRRILRPPQREPVKQPTQKELAAAAKRSRLAEIERKLDVGRMLKSPWR